LYERDFYTENVLEHRGVGFDFYSNRPSVFSIKGIRLPVYGKHQIRNAALSIETLLLLLKQQTPSEDTIVHALSSVEFPGRSDIRRINNRDIMFDGAHNPAAAEALGDTLRGLINSGTYSSIIVVLGIMSDKDIGGVMEPLINVADKLVLTRAAYGRSATTETLKAMAEKITRANGSPCGEIITANTVREALHRAQSLSSPDDLIVVTGSFYTAGEALELYGYRAVLTDLRERR
jgi:dihydrofolate synthase/folylpolyglutamate synthase